MSGLLPDSSVNAPIAVNISALSDAPARANTIDLPFG